MKKFAVLNLVLVLSLMLGVVAFAADDIQTEAYTYFSGGVKNITADVVYDNLNDGDDSNNPYIVSVRKQEDYEQAHIPTAVWMDAKTLFTAESLAKLPTDKQIMVYCYTGQTASQVVSALRMLGYDAYNLLFGFGAWNADAPTSKTFDQAAMGNDYAVDSGPGIEHPIVYPLATPLADTIQGAADAYFSGGTKSISPADLYDNLNDGDSSNDPYVLSVRSGEDYEKGHIPGAINIPPSELFIEVNLSRLPSDKQIVVYCYTGQTGSQVTSALRMLGYNAYNMLWGMQAWSMDKDVVAKMYNPEKHSFGYAYEGTAAGAATEEATPEATAEATPETMPETGGMPFPLEGVLLGFGALTAEAGLYLRRRKAA